MSIEALTKAGPIARIARVGHAPFDIDDPIEIAFVSGAVIHIDIGFEAATDIIVREGPLLDYAYGHLEIEEPDTYAAIVRDWEYEKIDLPWLIGAGLDNPRRLTMTSPYSVDVGYVFSVNGRKFALFGEADVIHAAALDDPELKSFKLVVGAPYSAA